MSATNIPLWRVYWVNRKLSHPIGKEKSKVGHSLEQRQMLQSLQYCRLLLLHNGTASSRTIPQSGLMDIYTFVWNSIYSLFGGGVGGEGRAHVLRGLPFLSLSELWVTANTFTPTFSVASVRHGTVMGSAQSSSTRNKSYTLVDWQ